MKFIAIKLIDYWHNPNEGFLKIFILGKRSQHFSKVSIALIKYANLTFGKENTNSCFLAPSGNWSRRPKIFQAFTVFFFIFCNQALTFWELISPLKCLSNWVICKQAITCSKLTIETLEQGVKYVQS